MNAKNNKRNIYQHEIELKTIRILNAPRDQFRKELEKLPYRGYEVEQLQDGRKIVIAKPGGKSVYGKPKKEDFFVWVFDPIQNTLWQISHKQIYYDIELKAQNNKEQALIVIDCLRKVCEGEDPDNIISNITMDHMEGEPLEVLLKSYKWIWGQEDINYPTGKGRQLSMEGISELKERLENI
jgi:hypothetical protein